MAGKASSQLKRNIAIIVILSGLVGACGGSPAGNSDKLSAAQNYYQAREFASAIIELKNALKKEPKNVAARKLLGEIYFQQGSFVAAEKELDKAYRLQGRNHQVVLSYAKILLRVGNFEQFAQVLQPTKAWTVAEQNQARSLRLISLTEQDKLAEAKELLKLSLFVEPSSIDAIYAKAMFHSRNNQLQQSQDLVASLLKQDADHLEGLILQGDLFLYHKDYDNALVYFKKASANQPLNPRLKIKMVQTLLGQQKAGSAVNILTQVLKRAPLYHEANYYYAYIKLQQQDYETALVHANKVLERIPTHVKSQFVAANAAYFLKRYESSYRLSRRLAAKFPDNSSVLKLLAGNQLSLKLHDEAIVTLAKIDDSQLEQEDVSLFVEAASSLSNSDDLLTRKKLYLQAAQAAPENNKLKLELASIALLQGNTDEGNKYLLTALAQDPDSSVIKAALISAYLNNNQLAKAQTAIEQFILDDVNNPDGYSLQGLLYLKQDKQDLAVAAFKQALTLSPNDPNANHNLGVIAIIAEDFSLAKSYYLQIIKGQAGNVRALTQLSLLDKKLGNHPQSLVWLEQAVNKNPEELTVSIALAESYIMAKKYQPVIDLLQPLGKIFVKELRIRLLLGQAYFLTQQPKLALAQFERATTLQPQEPTSYFWSSIILEQTRDFDNALIAANKALALAPTHKPTSMLVLRLSLKTGQLTMAESLVENLIVSYPDDVVILEFQAKLTLLNRDYKKAASLLTTIFERKKTNAILVQLVNALVKNGQSDLAFDHLTSWQKQYPDDLLILNVLANEYLRSGQRADARALLSTIVQLTPDNSLAQNNLAWLLFKQGNIAAAQVHAEHAYRVSPKSPEILDTLGQIQLAQGEYAKSRKILSLASRKMPDNLETKFYLAQATVLNGDKATAKSLLQQILSDKNSNTKSALAVRRDSRLLLAELQN